MFEINLSTTAINSLMHRKFTWRFIRSLKTRADALGPCVRYFYLYTRPRIVQVCRLVKPRCACAFCEAFRRLRAHLPPDSCRAARARPRPLNVHQSTHGLCYHRTSNKKLPEDFLALLYTAVI